MSSLVLAGKPSKPRRNFLARQAMPACVTAMTVEHAADEEQPVGAMARAGVSLLPHSSGSRVL